MVHKSVSMRIAAYYCSVEYAPRLSARQAPCFMSSFTIAAFPLEQAWQPDIARYTDIKHKLIERKKQLNANNKVTLDISLDCQVERGKVVVVPQLDGEASVYLSIMSATVL